MYVFLGWRWRRWMQRVMRECGLSDTLVRALVHGWRRLDVQSQHAAELCGLEKAVRLACNVKRQQVHIFADSNSPICLLMLFKCPVGMAMQARVLKRILYRIRKSEVVVFVHWVLSEIQPADPLSRPQSHCGGDGRTANAQAW